MKFKRVLAICVVLFPVVSAYLDVEIQKFEQSIGTDVLDFTTVKVRKVNKTRALFGEVVYHVPMDNSYIVTAKTYKKQGGEYRIRPYVLKGQGFCDFMNKDVIMYPECVKYSDFEKPMPCPIEPKGYKIYGFVPTLKSMSVFLETASNGDFAAEVYVSKNDTVVVQFRAYIGIVHV